jgi:O-antigen/teichoic acid export membrane protein
MTNFHSYRIAVIRRDDLTSGAEGKEHADLQRHMVRGWAWMLGTRWILRLTGLINTVVLARLLTPADFGIVAIATMIVGLVEIFGQTGQSSALIRHPNPTREHYDSAWTIQLLLGFALGLIVLALTPITTIYFHEPRAKLIVEILAFRTMLAGSQNIAVLNFRRTLRFERQFWFGITPSIVSLIVTIAAGFLLRNYWALVIGIISQHLVNFVLGYVMEPFRPRFSLSKAGEIWSFSTWAFIRYVGTYLNTLVDRVAIGGFAGSDAMGRYYVATDIATSPSQELVGPMTSVLFPVMATVQAERDKRRKLYLTALYWSALICTSTAIGVALVADDLVDLVLGPQWQDAKPLIPWLALSYGVLGMTSSAYTALDTIGKPLLSARLQWFRLAGFVLAMIPVAYFFRDLEAIAAMRLIITIVTAPALFLVLMEPFDLAPADFAGVLWRPVSTGLIMALAVVGMNSFIPFGGSPRFLLDILAGAASYVGALMILWLLSGRPDGPEKEAWERGRPLLVPLRRGFSR